MGNGVVTHSLFESSYQNERKALRHELMLQFESNPRNYDILQKIKIVRDIVTQNSHICETAARELKKEADDGPTNQQAAFNELDRLLTIYETSTILKSVQCRIGPVACPLGHFAAYFDNFDILTIEKKKKPKCNICEKVVDDGYHCSYCMYNMCVPCSAVYCSYGHPMRLWTHPESEHNCDICKKEPIHSGYRCVKCDIDFCDYCTWKDGRTVVKNIIYDRMATDLKYIENHIDESETALKTIETHKKKREEDAYPTIKHLYDFSQSLHQIKEICVAEVKQTRITRAIIKYRSILVVGKEYSRTAYEVSLVVDTFTQEEKERLEKLLARHDYLKSLDHRLKCSVACPLGHGLMSFSGIPPLYSEKFSKIKKTTPTRPDLFCRVCRRNASPGFHCDYCEYELCQSCGVVWCADGHPMTMWTELESQESCFLCQKQPIVTGYRCMKCQVDLCDMCTSKEGRDRIRTNWETELKQLLQFMLMNKAFSDIALFYEWRHANQVASIGLLVDYVKELRVAKKKVEKQVAQKEIIDKIKLLRGEIIKHPDLCATAARESLKSDIYVFANKTKAIEEMKRLSEILKSYIIAQNQENRSKHGIACPLSHGMIPIEATALVDEDSFLPDSLDTATANDDNVSSVRDGVMVEKEQNKTKENQKGRDSNDNANPLNALVLSTSSPNEKVISKKHSTSMASPETNDIIMVSLNEETTPAPLPSRKQKRVCQICASTSLLDGHTCSICEYDLCGDCSVIYCRLGHPLKIWTMPEAQSLYCDLCKSSPLIAGYRCLTCQLDICDMCTTRDSRNAFMLWPRREFHRIVDYLDSIKYRSAIAKRYIEENQLISTAAAAAAKKKAEEEAGGWRFSKSSSSTAMVPAAGVSKETNNNNKDYLMSMSKLCKKLQEALEVKKQVEEELFLKPLPLSLPHSPVSGKHEPKEITAQSVSGKRKG